MRVCSNSSSYGQPVRAGLFLGYSPRLAVGILKFEITVNQFWPLNPRFHLQDSALTIQMEHSIQPSDIDQQGIGAKLLPSHRVPPTCNRDHLPIFSGSTNDGLHIFQRSRIQNRLHPREIKLGMNIVDKKRSGF